MSLLKTWAPYFKSHARREGRSCYQKRAVDRLDPHNGQLIHARVTDGDQEFTVTLWAQDATTTASCTCPGMDAGTYCKHIWATLLCVHEHDGLFAHDAVEAELVNPRPPRARRRRADEKPSRHTQPLWNTRLDLMQPIGLESRQATPWLLTPRRVCYLVDPEQSMKHERLVIDLRQTMPASIGSGRPTPLKINQKNVCQLPDPIDRELCALLLGAGSVPNEDELQSLYRTDAPTSSFVLPAAAQRTLIRNMIQTGYCFVKDHTLAPDTDAALSWDGDEPWLPWLVGRYDNQTLCVDMELRRGPQCLGIDGPQLLLGGPTGLVIYDHHVAMFDDRDAYRCVAQFREESWLRTQKTPTIVVPADEIPRFLDRLYRMARLPMLDLPEGIGRQAVHMQPTAHLELLTPPDPARTIGPKPTPRGHLLARVWFAYGTQRVEPGQGGWLLCDGDTPSDAQAQAPQDPGSPHEPSPQLIHRDTQAEQDAIARLWPLGFRPVTDTNGQTTAIVLPQRSMAQAVNRLLDQDWVVTADDRVVRRPGSPVLSVTSGIDWFELRGSVRYETDRGAQDVPLMDILCAASAGKSMVALDDGSQAMLPQQWLTHEGLLAGIGKHHKDHVRFGSAQAMILDSLLTRMTHADVDERFELIRQRINQFTGVTPVQPGPHFTGRLRPYQGEGVGWMTCLRTLAMGAILADDMGLGKTVQVLAVLDAIYNGPGYEPGAQPPALTEGDHLPTLIVVPRSIVFNWIDEAKRFAPKLKVQAYAGADRHSLRAVFSDHHVIVTSYGLMRRDFTLLAQQCFEYVVLDEAQAIKNPASQSAKAARLLNARHRLALTGTPVENHLSDLWSIFEFLNPGMLGTNTRFARLIRRATRHDRGRPPANEMHTHSPPADSSANGAVQIAQALRPFILRRTKQQVLDDLPEKTEQTILCQMEPKQRKLYDGLLRHYRNSLLGQDAHKPSGDAGPAEPVAGQQMMVLEALLRLRQVACHPGLIDPSRADDTSAKLDVLMDRLDDLIEEGHKALVFSQFTSMLALVRRRLDTRGITYAYLDGKTRHRAQTVARFQTDPDCPLFLISLKAGGLGLNLTAAGYVFILDPWWNPAVEAQAIDRTHRIGQTRHVFAYRLICEDTVEQRIAQLQNRKRVLAEAIVGGQENLLQSLTREDLQYLLS